MTGTVTAITPTVPLRAHVLPRAVASVRAQTYPVAAHIVEVDVDHEGPGATRNRAIAAADSEWLAFLDDDDWWFPGHVADCLTAAETAGADLIYPVWEHGAPGHDPTGLMGRSFDAARLRQANFIPISVLVRTDWVRKVGGFPTGPDIPLIGTQPCEDWGLWLRLLDAGAVFAPLHKVTWHYLTHPRQYAGAIW